MLGEDLLHWSSVSGSLSSMICRAAGRRQYEVDHQAGRSLARLAPSQRFAARPPGRRHRRYRRSSSLLRSVPRELVHSVDSSGVLPDTRSAHHEWRAPPSTMSRLPHTRATLARTRSRRHSPRFQGQSDIEPSFDTSLTQDAIAQSSGILLRMNGNPDFLAGGRMLQQEVTAFPEPDLNESCGLQPPDHFSPSHLRIVNLSLGSINSWV